MEKRDLTIGIVGSGGDGVVATGDIITKASAHEGLHCMMVKSFGPQIRGGESSCRLRISEGSVYSHGSGLNVLVCFNWADYLKFSDELEVEEDVVILVDSADATPENDIPIEGGKRRTIFRVPFAKISADIKNPKGKNMVMLGVLTELFSLPTEGIEVSLRKKFQKKKPEIVESNLAAVKAGADHVKENHLQSPFKFAYTKHEPKMMVTGNEAVAFGAIAAGCKFYASYPITPASEIMEWLSRELPKFGGTVVQAEDEISAVCMVTGASYGGVKSMTATSGPGLSLKLEAIGLGTMAELPYVVVDVQRGGPSTGLPTKAEQGDLFQSIYGMHGDAPHAVIAASDVEDCFRATVEAFNVAEEYQMPVLLMSDQYLGHRTETVRELNFESLKLKERLAPRQLSKGGYKRYADTQDGISPMTWPGVKDGAYLCSGIEHDEWGAPSAKYSMHEKMSLKRAKKLEKLARDYKFIRRYGQERPDVCVIGWGSSKGVVREAVEYFATKNKSVGGLVPQLIYPLQKDMLKDFFSKANTVVVVENCLSGQFLSYLKGNVDLPKRVLHLNIAGGRLITVREVICEIDKAFL